MPDRGKEFVAPVGLGPKTKTQTATDVGTSTPVTSGAAKSRESVAAAGTGRPATGKM